MIERRRYERVPFHCRTTVSARPGGPPVEAWTVDLSLGGARLASERFFPPRQMISVRFHLRDADQADVIEQADGVVVHSRPESEGYTFGVEFLAPLDASEHPLLIRKMELY